VANPEAYGKEFAPNAQAIIKGAGAKFVLIRGAGGASAKPITSLEGTPPKRITVQQWENMDALRLGTTARTIKKRWQSARNTQRSADTRSKASKGLHRAGGRIAAASFAFRGAAAE
jgi:hypothetical protein